MSDQDDLLDALSNLTTLCRRAYATVSRGRPLPRGSAISMAYRRVVAASARFDAAAPAGAGANATRAAAAAAATTTARDAIVDALVEAPDGLTEQELRARVACGSRATSRALASLRGSGLAVLRDGRWAVTS